MTLQRHRYFKSHLALLAGIHQRGNLTLKKLQCRLTTERKWFMLYETKEFEITYYDEMTNVISSLNYVLQFTMDAVDNMVL